MPLRENDLANTVLKKISIDEFEPKTGTTENVSVRRNRRQTSNVFANYSAIFNRCCRRDVDMDTAKAMRNFANAGFKSNIRKGIASKDEGRIPALLPLPDCYSTGPVAVESEKSYLAAKIMNDLRAHQVDSNTGDVRREAVPLFHRVSMDEGETYSDLVGRPFHFMDPRRKHKPLVTGGYS